MQILTPTTFDWPALILLWYNLHVTDVVRQLRERWRTIQLSISMTTTKLTLTWWTQLSLASSPTLEANPKLGGNIWNIKLKGYTDCALNIINMFFLSALRVTKVTVVRNISSVTLVFADTLSETLSHQLHETAAIFYWPKQPQGGLFCCHPRWNQPVTSSNHSPTIWEIQF